MPSRFRSQTPPSCAATPPRIAASLGSGLTRYGRGSAAGRPAAFQSRIQFAITFRSPTLTGAATRSPVSGSISKPKSYSSSTSGKCAPRLTIFQSSGRASM